MLLAIYETYSSWSACTRKGYGCDLYTQGLNTGGSRLIGASPSTVLKWIKAFAKAHYENPVLGDAIIIEIDEM